MILPHDLDLTAPRDTIVDRLVTESGYERDAAEAIADELLSDEPALLE